MKHTAKWLAALLAMALLFSAFGGVSAGAAGAEGSFPGGAFLSPATPGEQGLYDDDEEVGVIVVLEGGASADFGTYESEPASVRRQKLLEEQDAMLGKIGTTGIAFAEGYRYSALLNGFSGKMRYGDIAALEKMDGVAYVALDMEFRVPEEEIRAVVSNELTGMDLLQNVGIVGQGITIAVLDTGLYCDHEAFADYGLTEGGMTKEYVEGLIAEGKIAKGQYLSAKVPFAYDYFGEDDNVSDGIGHGTHVCGIAAGYAEDEEGNVTFSGAAPAAQLVVLKIFPDKNGGSPVSLEVKALEDAYALGVDVINMSLGSPNGFVTENAGAVYQEIFRRLDEAGILVYAAAGNEYSQALKTENYYAQMLAALGYGSVSTVLPTTYTEYGVIGSPACWPGNTSVASSRSSHETAYTLQIGDQQIWYLESDATGKTPFLSAFREKTMEYVLVPNFGEEADYAGLDVEGKLAVVYRGGVSFQEKLDYAAAAGAAGLIVLNTTEHQRIRMTLDDPKIPSVTVLYEDIPKFLAAAPEGIGELTVVNAKSHVYAALDGGMSAFSSLGVTSELTFGPMITGIGENIVSADYRTMRGYTRMSGTSMATPNVAGTVAGLLSFYQAAYPDMTRKARTELLEKVIFSTARVLDDGTCFYSPRKQGAGQIDAVGAFLSQAYVEEPLVALKDSESGNFAFSVTVKNMAETDVTFAVTPVFMTERILLSSAELGTFTMTEGDDLLSDAWYDCTVEGAEDGTLTVPAKGEATVNVTVTVTAKGRLILDSYFPYGTYLDGYLFFDDVNATVPGVHASVIGFYGDWAAAPAFECYDSFDVITANAVLDSVDPLTGKTYREEGRILGELLPDRCVGVNEVWLQDQTSVASPIYLGENRFLPVPYLDGRAAVNNGSGTGNCVYQGLRVTPALLRNASAVILFVTDAQSGEVYFVDATPNVPKNTYNTQTGKFDGGYYSCPDLSGIPEGTELIVETVALQLYSTPDLYDRLGAIGDDAELYRYAMENAYGNVWSFSLSIDNSSPVPVAVERSEEDDGYVLSFRDENFLSAVTLKAEKDGKTYALKEQVYGNPAAGATETFFLPDGLSAGFYRLEAEDYATNYAAYPLYVDNAGAYHFYDAETGNCMICGEGDWSDGELFAEVLDYTEYFGEYEVNVFSFGKTPGGVMTAMKNGDVFRYTEADTVFDLAAAKGAKVSFVFDGMELLLTFDAAAVKQLAAQNVASLDLSYRAENGVTFRIDASLGGADFSDGTVTVSETLIFGDEKDLRVYSIGDDGSYLPVEGFTVSSFDVCFQTTHFSSYLVALLDDYGHMIETLKVQAETAKAAAETAQAKAEAAEIAAEAVKTQAETAKTEAETAQVKAEAAEAVAEAMKAQAEAAKAAAETAQTKAEAAETAAEAMKAQAEARQAAAEAAQAKAERMASDAEAAATAAEKAQNAAREAKAAAKQERTAAEAAEAKAKAAEEEANAALTAAEAAKAQAETARAAAEAAKTQAAEECTAAEAAKTTAEAVLRKAEQAAFDAAKEAAKAEEMLRDLENVRLAAEAMKAQAAAEAAKAEKAKAEAEKTLAAAEAANADARAQATVALVGCAVSTVAAVAAAVFFFLARRKRS